MVMHLADAAQRGARPILAGRKLIATGEKIALELSRLLKYRNGELALTDSIFQIK